MISFSIIIPVLNEASLVNDAVGRALRIGSGFDNEIIVIDGDEDGRTINVLNDKSVITGISARGRGEQMNHGALCAKGDVLMFLHADTKLPDHALRSISSIMEDEECAGGAFDLGIESSRPVFRLIEKLVHFRTRLTGIPYGDQAIFIRKEVFVRMKGFKDIPLMEDVEFMKRLKRSGHKISIIPQKVLTSPRRWEEEGVLFCTLRNTLLRGFYELGVQPDKLARFYYPEGKK